MRDATRANLALLEVFSSTYELFMSGAGQHSFSVARPPNAAGPAYSYPAPQPPSNLAGPAHGNGNFSPQHPTGAFRPIYASHAPPLQHFVQNVMGGPSPYDAHQQQSAFVSTLSIVHTELQHVTAERDNLRTCVQKLLSNNYYEVASQMLKTSAERDEVKMGFQTVCAERDGLRTELQNVGEELHRTKVELQGVGAERDQLRVDIQTVGAARDGMKSELQNAWVARDALSKKVCFEFVHSIPC